jgi:hypothetical protein
MMNFGSGMFDGCQPKKATTEKTSEMYIGKVAAYLYRLVVQHFELLTLTSKKLRVTMILRGIYLNQYSRNYLVTSRQSSREQILRDVLPASIAPLRCTRPR